MCINTMGQSDAFQRPVFCFNQSFPNNLQIYYYVMTCFRSHDNRNHHDWHGHLSSGTAQNLTMCTLH